MQDRPQVGRVVGYPLIDQFFFSREGACRFVFSDVVTVGQVVEDRTYGSQGYLRISCNLPVLGASQFRFAQKRKGDFQSGGIVCSIFILERVVWPCLAPDIEGPHRPSGSQAGEASSAKNDPRPNPC